MDRGDADLRLAGVASVVAALVVLAVPHSGVPTVIAGIPLTLALPGYALTRAVFREPLGAGYYVVLSLALSISVTILGALVLNALWPSARPLSSGSWAALLCAVTVAAATFAHRRGHVGPPAPRLPAPPRARDAALLGVALLVTGGAVSLARTPLPPPHGVTGYTQLWLVPHAPTATLGVRSKELHPARFRLRLALDGRTIESWKLRLAPGQGWSVDLPIDSPRAGYHLGEATLYRLPDRKRAYRRVRVNLGTATERRP